MKTNLRTQAMIFSAMLFSVTSLRADVLAFWGMPNTTPSQMIIPTSVDTGVVTAGNLTANSTLTGPGINLGANATYFAYNYLAFSRSNVSGGAGGDLTLSQVYADGTYFSFTITPDVGQTITVDSLSFDAMISNPSPPANREFFVESNETGYGNNISDVLLSGGTVSANSGTVFGYAYTSSSSLPYNNSSYTDQNYSVDLSGNSAFANLSGPVTFRIYIGTDTVSQNVGFSQVDVVGSVVAVPEPSSLAFLGLGALALAVSHRRRQA